MTVFASTFAVGGRRVSTSGLDSGMTSEPSCLVAECVTESSAVDDSADILAACDGMTPPEGLRASLSDWTQGW